MDPKIIRPDESEEFYTEERCFILEVFNQPQYAPFSIARTRVKPGVTTALHALKGTDEVYYLLEGEGQMELGVDIEGKVKSGDIVTIPADTSQRIANTGEEDLIFLCICAPRFEVERYVEIEEG